MKKIVGKSTPNPLKTICVYDNDRWCEIKDLCNPLLSESDCQIAPVKNPESTKCVYDEGCKLKELCEIENAPSEEKCKQIKTSKKNTKCVFENSKCVVKEINSSSQIYLSFIIIFLLLSLI